MEFNTRTRTGTFYIASGIASLAGRTRSIAACSARRSPTPISGVRRSRSSGPRPIASPAAASRPACSRRRAGSWSSDSVTLTLEEHAFLKNAVLKVKGVPLFYLPVMYYPINKEDRATGFLIPTYGSSTIRGQTLSNAFFWAINRSQDATFYHDCYSKTGQGFGGEYRYVAGAGVGRATAHFQVIDEHDAIYEQPDGTRDRRIPAAPAIRSAATWRSSCPATCGSRPTPTTSPASRAQQRYQQDIYQLTNSTRRYDVNLDGQLGPLLAQHHASIARRRSASDNVWSLYGSAPRMTVTPRRSADRQAAAVLRRLRRVRRRCCASDESANVETRSRPDALRRRTRRCASRSRAGPFLTFNSSVAVARHLLDREPRPDCNGPRRSRKRDRAYATSTCRRGSPVRCSRGSSTRRSSAYAQKFKHVIEPTLTIQRVTPIDNYEQHRQARRHRQRRRAGHAVHLRSRTTGSTRRRERAREILSVSISQTLLHRRQRRAVRSRTISRATTTALPPSHFSPVVAAGARVADRRSSTRRSARSTTPRCTRCARWPPTATLQQRSMGVDQRRLEPAAVHPGPDRLQQPAAAPRTTSTRRRTSAAGQPPRRRPTRSTTT